MNLGILEEEVLNLQSIIIRNWRPFVKSQGCVCVGLSLSVLVLHCIYTIISYICTYKGSITIGLQYVIGAFSQ